MMDSVKKAFVLCPKALKLFYVVAAVNVAANLINAALISAPVTGEMSLGRSLSVIAATIVMFVAAIFLQGGALSFVKDLVKNGAADIAALLNNCKKYFVKMLLLTLILTVAAVVVLGLAGLLTAVLPGILKAILWVIIGIAMMAFLIMPAYALVGSDLSVIPALKTGVLMGKDRFLQILGILGIMIVVGIVVFLAAGILTGIFSLIAKPAAGILTGIVIAIANAALTVVVNIAFMDLYLKSRV